MRFLLVDDHAYLRRGVLEILVRAYPGAEFGEAWQGADAIAHVHREAWDLVILDLSLPGRDGLDVLKDLIAIRTGLRVLVLSAQPEEHYAVRALRAGAAGFLAKGAPPDELCAAAAKILAGGRYVSPWLGERLAARLLDDERPPHEHLSDRELQVLRMIGAGRSVKEIAGELCLSDKTVSTYRARILEKLGMKSNAELMRYALDAGLVQ